MMTFHGNSWKIIIFIKKIIKIIFCENSWKRKPKWRQFHEKTWKSQIFHVFSCFFMKLPSFGVTISTVFETCDFHEFFWFNWKFTSCSRRWFSLTFYTVWQRFLPKFSFFHQKWLKINIVSKQCKTQSKINTFHENSWKIYPKS